MAGQPYHIADGTLRFAPSRLDISVRPGAVREGSITVTGREGDSVLGFVRACSLRLFVSDRPFDKNPDVITWHYDASCCVEGDEEEGILRVFSSHGEYRIPYHVRVEKEEVSYADVRALPAEEEAAADGENEGKGTAGQAPANPGAVRFTSLAKADWPGAVRRFYRRDFGLSLISDEEKMLWRGLRVRAGDEQAVEEFLMTAAGKNPVTYEADCREVRREIIGKRGSSGIIAGQPIRIRREGWGFTQLDVIWSGDFFAQAPVRLTREDFITEECEVGYAVDTRRLHAGRNFGMIILRATGGEIRSPVEIFHRGEAGARRYGERESGRLLLDLMRAYEKLRLHALQTDEWIRQTEEILRRLSAADRSSPLPGLYTAHFLLMQGRVHRAIREIEAVRRRLAGARPGEVLEMGYAQYEGETDVMYAYRQFLTAAAYDDREVITPRVIRLLHDRYRRNPREWRIAWMLLQLSDEYAPGTANRWLFLLKQFQSGARSPILYLEAWDILRGNPALLETGLEKSYGRTGGREPLYGLLLYALRKEIMTEEVVETLIGMAVKRRSFSAPLYRLLSGAYEADSLQHMRPDLLRAICGFLIRGNVSGPAYFVWFSRAVDRGMKITRLADYYLQSMPEDHSGIIPDPVMREASRTAVLPLRTRAYFYGYLLQNRRRFPQLFDSCRETMHNFIREQIEEGRISAELAVLYQYCLGEDILSPRQKEKLVRLSHVCQLRTTRTQLTRAVILYPQDTEERSCLLENGNGLLSVYGDENCILFEDRGGVRYAGSVPYTLDRLMEPLREWPGTEDSEAEEEQTGQETAAVSAADTAYALEASGAAAKDYVVTQETVRHCEVLVRSDRLQPDFRAHIALCLMRYYLREGDGAGREAEMAASLASRMDPVMYSRKEQAELIALFEEGGLRREVLRWVSACGTSLLPAALVSRIGLAMAEPDPGTGRGQAGEESRERIAQVLALEAYRRGDRDPRILTLLLSGAALFSSELEQLAEEAGGAREETPAMMAAQQRILEQILFTGQITKGQADMIDRALLQRPDLRPEAEAALEQYCCCVFAGKIPAEGITKVLGDMDLRGEALPDIGSLVFLKAYADGDEQGARADSLAERALRSLVRSGIVFPFFRRLPGSEEVLRRFARETMLEYHDPSGAFRPSGHVVIHYAHERGGRQEDFRVREMREMYRGFYVSSFYLFRGEQLHYFITDDAEEKNIVESGTVSQDIRVGEAGRDRFGRLDAIAGLLEEHRREDALRELRDYRRQQYLTRVLFADKEEDGRRPE